MVRRATRLLVILLSVLAPLSAGVVYAQAYERELEAPGKALITINNRNGRVVVEAREGQAAVSLKAESETAEVSESEVSILKTSSGLQIDVKPSLQRERIDLTVLVPERSRLKVTTDAGSVDIIGNVETANVQTDTGTIRASVPTDAVNVRFVWQASVPRYFSEVELPKPRERAAGMHVVSGWLGEKDSNREDRIRLDFATRRGVVLFNVEPEMVPSDLRERPLTDAARAIVRSGDADLVDAIRKASPRHFGDYARTLPPPKESPLLVRSTPPGSPGKEVAPRTLRLNASVTDRNGRAIAGLNAADFTVFENGEIREIVDVRPSTAPFNLVLLLDVSGSVHERIDFIRKAARNFLATMSQQDRIAITSFRDDIQVIADFTSDRRALSISLDRIEAGGATALYDSIAYTLVETLQLLRGERTAIVILSDGDDNKSFIPFPALAEAVIESGALIYPLYIPSSLIPENSVPASETTLDPVRTRYMTLTTRAEQEGETLGKISGGVYYPIRRLEDLQAAYEDVVSQLRMAYTITYRSSSPGTGERRLRVRTSREGAAVRLSQPVEVASR